MSGSSYKESGTTPQQVAYWRAKFDKEDAAMLDEEAQWEGLGEAKVPSPEDELLVEEEWERLVQLLDRLPDHMKGPIRKICLDGLTLEEYAEAHHTTRQRAADGMIKGLNALRWWSRVYP